KWNMGWMNDTLSYMDLDSVYRRYHHDLLTFPMVYAFNESHVLPLSHDEVVHGKHSLIGRMPGNYDEKFRQLRLLYMYQFAIPGKKLLFMGGEFGQFIEWNFRKSLDWFLLDYDSHSDMQLFTRELNRFYRRTPELFSLDESWEGFMWLSVNDALHSIIAFLRMDGRGGELMCAFNFTPVKHEHYRVYLPEGSTLTQVMSNVDLREIKNLKTARDQDGNHFIDIMLSPYEAVFYRVTHEHGGRIS
ncbi:MAG TPA: alpha amylase C-terminal domain-containing protein, partial [Clostridia bacterium]|nr:alpha amylase C-terminal domain-containing protein [Clostridia bacterium]